MTTATTLALAGIRLYQRRLSPLKGFRCAHAAWHGGPSCSAAVLEIVQTQGLRRGWPLILARFGACRLAYAQLRQASPARPGPLGVVAGGRVRGLCCCGPVPIPFRCG